ncbi:hypothetical protein HQ535_08040, partial [bacterium]|nr:hypothetical protein [bacterium]
MTRRPAFTLVAILTAAILAIPTAALAQVVPPEPPPPCWDCFPFVGEDVTVESYDIDTVIDGQVATTRVTQVLRNDGRGDAEALVLFPVPPDGVLTGLTLWIDGEPVQGEVLDAGEARST